MVDSLSAAMPDLPLKRRVPGYAPWLLVIAPIVALPLMLVATVIAAGLAPLGDPTPVLVVSVSLLARRWEGARSRLFDACAILAGVAIVEYVAVYVPLRFGVLSESQLTWSGGLFGLYLLQMLGTLVLFGVACLSSVVRIVQSRRRSSPLSDG